MKLPPFNDLFKEQLAVFDSPPDQHLFAVGPPGSGKTSLAVMRGDFLSQKCQVALLTRNRMLAAAALQLGPGNYPVTTMHKFVSDHYRQRFQRNPPGYETYNYDWPVIMAEYGAIGWCPVLDNLIIDEGQNLPAEFFQWALRYGAKFLSVFADEDQGTEIYSASLKTLVSTGLPSPIRLQTNHRNTVEIAQVAEHFHHEGVLPPGVVVRPRNGDTPSFVKVASWQAIAELVAVRFRNRGRSIGVIVQFLDNAFQLESALREILTGQVRIDVYTNKADSGTEHAIITAAPGITIITSASVIGLEFEDVFVQDLSQSLPCKSQIQYRRMYMMCARARESLTLLDGPDHLTPMQIAALPDSTILTR